MLLLSTAVTSAVASRAKAHVPFDPFAISLSFGFRRLKHFHIYIAVNGFG
jgi:hypothetical protein